MIQPRERTTKLVTIDPSNPDPVVLRVAGSILRGGGLVAFPTETVYGLGANALDATAVKGIFAAKERPAHDPVIVHIADRASLPQLATEITPLVQTLTEHFWPGPLTLVLPRSDLVPDSVTAGGPTVAVRSPSHPLAQALIRAAGAPIAAPSANRFSQTSPTTAQHVWDDLHGRVDLILDGGPTSVGIESTVLDTTVEPPVLLRPGGVTSEEIEKLIGPLRYLSAGDVHQVLPSPGMLERHYAPKAALWLFIGEDAEIHYALRSVAKRLIVAEHRIGLLLADEDRLYLDGLDAERVYLGSSLELEHVARNLYHGMRTLDGLDVEVILARDFPQQGLGTAIRDRLRRAAQQVMDAGTAE